MSRQSRNYLTLGLRRDANFSDVQDATLALNNLLDNLVSTSDATLSFVSPDLDAIRGIRNTNITTETLVDVAGITVQFSKVNIAPETGNVTVVIEPVAPLIRLVDRLENAYNVTSRIPAISGGTGLNCRFIESPQIKPGPLTRTSTGDDIFEFVDTQQQEIFWQSFELSFGSAIDPAFVDQGGGLHWTGWFSPSLRDPDVNIRITTTGLFMFEVDLKEDDNWQSLASIYAPTRTVTTTDRATASTTDTVLLTPGDGKFVSAGDRWGSGTIVVNSIDVDTVLLSGSVDLTAGVNSIDVFKLPGDTVTDSIVRMPSVTIGGLIKIRISVWWPDPQNSQTKTINFGYRSGFLGATRLYSVPPSDELQPLEIRKFLSDIITPARNTFGPFDDKNFHVNQIAFMNFDPVSGFSEVLKHGPVIVSVTDFNRVIRFAEPVPSMSIGNIIVPTSSNSFIGTLPNRAFVIEDIIGSSVAVSGSQSPIDAETEVLIVENKGFVDWVYGIVDGLSVTIVEGNADLLRNDYIAITTTTAPNSWVRVKEINKTATPATFTTSTSLGSGTDPILILIYSDKSLIDASKDVVCAGVLGQVTSTTVSTGNAITLVSIAGVSTGQVIQFAPVIPANTTVSSVNGTTITISSPIAGEILAGSTLVFAPAGTTADVEGCIIPLDTAPPFVGTLAGLSTVHGIRTVDNNPTLAIIVNELQADIPPAHITPVQLPATVNRKLQIILETGVFSILATNA